MTLKDVAIMMEDDIPRDGGVIPEYAKTMLISIQSYENRVACGEVQSFCFDEPFAFTGYDQLLLVLESIMDKVEHPQACMERRTIAPVKGKKPCKAAPFVTIEDEHMIKDLRDVRDMKVLHKGGVCIRIYARQHASIQGFLRVKNRTKAFRSGIELIGMLHEYAAIQFQKQKNPENNLL